MATGNSINANSTGIQKYDGAGTFSATTVTQHNAIVGGASNALTSIALTNGQLLIGSTGADPVAGTITAGTGVTIGTGAGTTTVNAVGGGLTWTVITVNQTAAVNNGYICNKGSTLALLLPAASAVGDMLSVTGINTATGWQITQAAGQQIFFGTQSTTSGATGTLTSTQIRDSITLVCIAANLTWNVLSSVGNITVV
jgi:hypothetical protein